MITLRHIERLWTKAQYDRLFHDLISTRPEASLRLQIQLQLPAAAAAITVLRLDELNQSHSALYPKVLRTLLASQQADGGFGDPLTTALCTRALLACNGNGAAIDRGLLYLANLQKTEGIWPNVPLRRMPADPFVSAFILYQLGAFPRFRSAVRFLDALNWFEQHEGTLDPETHRLWDRASLRCHLTPTPTELAWC
jgi:hypothetical protein